MPTHGDWWLVTDRNGRDRVTVMHYDPIGRFVGAGSGDDGAVATFRSARDWLWAAAEPFGSWWARHPELRRLAAG